MALTPVALILIGILVLAAILMIVKRLMKFGCILLVLAIGVVLYYLYLR